MIMYRPAVQPETCQWCGTPIERGRRGNIRLYCSGKCRLQAWISRQQQIQVAEQHGPHARETDSETGSETE